MAASFRWWESPARRVLAEGQRVNFSTEQEAWQGEKEPVFHPKLGKKRKNNHRPALSNQIAHRFAEGPPSCGRNNSEPSWDTCIGSPTRTTAGSAMPSSWSVGATSATRLPL